VVFGTIPTYPKRLFNKKLYPRISSNNNSRCRVDVILIIASCPTFFAAGTCKWTPEYGQQGRGRLDHGGTKAPPIRSGRLVTGMTIRRFTIVSRKLHCIYCASAVLPLGPFASSCPPNDFVIIRGADVRLLRLPSPASTCTLEKCRYTSTSGNDRDNVVSFLNIFFRSP